MSRMFCTTAISNMNFSTTTSLKDDGKCMQLQQLRYFKHNPHEKSSNQVINKSGAARSPKFTRAYKSSFPKNNVDKLFFQKALSLKF